MSFIGENLLFFSTINLSPFITLFVLISSTLLLPIYFIYFYQRISYGKLSPYFISLSQDLTIKELNVLFPLLLLNTLFGIFPYIIIESLTMPI